MGKMRHIGEASTSGAMSVTVTNTMSEKWLRAIHLAWTPEEQWFKSEVLLERNRACYDTARYRDYK